MQNWAGWSEVESRQSQRERDRKQHTTHLLIDNEPQVLGRVVLGNLLPRVRRHGHEARRKRMFKAISCACLHCVFMRCVVWFERLRDVYLHPHRRPQCSVHEH